MQIGFKVTPDKNALIVPLQYLLFYFYLFSLMDCRFLLWHSARNSIKPSFTIIKHLNVCFFGYQIWFTQCNCSFLLFYFWFFTGTDRVDLAGDSCHFIFCLLRVPFKIHPAIDLSVHLYVFQSVTRFHVTRIKAKMQCQLPSPAA